jgi:hypothetical protein
MLALPAALAVPCAVIGRRIAVCLAHSRTLLLRQAVDGLAPFFHGLLPLFCRDGLLIAVTLHGIVGRKHSAGQQQRADRKQNGESQISHFSLLDGYYRSI